jgi:nitrite reductase (NO-forming)
MGLARRDLFRLGAAGGGLGLLGALGGWQSRRIAAPKTFEMPLLPVDCASDGGAGALYDPRYSPPRYLTDGGRDALHTPPPRCTEVAGALQEIDLPIIQTTLEVADGRSLPVWAYGGSVPGPILRATLGGRLRVIVGNHSPASHSLHFHGSHELAQDGMRRIAPGEQEIYEFTAGPVGLHPYHCHVPPYACHIGRGMYGTLIVDPPAGRAPASEFVLCLCGFDVDRTGRNDTYAWNGVAGYYERFPLKVQVGELVRIYLVNMVENDSVASFHLHAQTFDVYRSGTAVEPNEHTDLLTLGPAERAILEFRLPRRGRYMFHPHQSHMAERGAMGFIAAV